MKLELNELYYKTAIDIIQWCYYNNIDIEKCQELIGIMSTVGDKSNIDWSLEIPDQYISWVLLKFA